MEEYPFGNSISAIKQEANYYDRPTLRLIPQKENSNHGEEMRKFLQYLQKVQNIKQPVYCWSTKNFNAILQRKPGLTRKFRCRSLERYRPGAANRLLH